MGLFGFVKKAIGKVAKAGLGIVTHGVSDKVLSVLKSANDQKKQGRALTLAQQAIAMRHLPETRTTEQNARLVLEDAQAGGGTVGHYKTRRPGRRARRASLARPGTTGKRRRRRGGGGRKAPASFAKFASRAKALAAEWRRLGGREGTGQTFFEWKAGR